jgi:hypothetical protein
MSLPRKDLRLKISQEAHDAIAELADFHEKDISELGALLFERAVIGELHVMRLQAERLARWGKRGNARETEGSRLSRTPTPVLRSAK